MNWTKLPAIKCNAPPCLCCGEAHDVLPMDARIAVGFGCALLSCDGETEWSEDGQDWDDCLTAGQADHMASNRPDCDWRIVLHGPLRGRTYQRQGDGHWVLVEQNRGFA